MTDFDSILKNAKTTYEIVKKALHIKKGESSPYIFYPFNEKKWVSVVEVEKLKTTLQEQFVFVPKSYIRDYWKACREFPNWTEEVQQNLKQLLKASGTSLEELG